MNQKCQLTNGSLWCAFMIRLSFVVIHNNAVQLGFRKKSHSKSVSATVYRRFIDYAWDKLNTLILCIRWLLPFIECRAWNWQAFISCRSGNTLTLRRSCQLLGEITFHAKSGSNSDEPQRNQDDFHPQRTQNSQCKNNKLISPKPALNVHRRQL